MGLAENSRGCYLTALNHVERRMGPDKVAKLTTAFIERVPGTATQWRPGQGHRPHAGHDDVRLPDHPQG